VKTDNSHLVLKQKIRRELYTPGDLVLDCCHGEGLLWKPIAPVVGIEMQKGKGDAVYRGKAEKIIPSLDLSKYKIIDVDTYGIPYTILKAIFENKTLAEGTVVIYTFIRTMFGVCDHSLLCTAGYTDAMIKKSPQMFNNRGWQCFCDWLLGEYTDRITDYCVEGKKHYGWIKTHKSVVS